MEPAMHSMTVSFFIPSIWSWQDVCEVLDLTPSHVAYLTDAALICRCEGGRVRAAAQLPDCSPVQVALPKPTALWALLVGCEALHPIVLQSSKQWPSELQLQHPGRGVSVVMAVAPLAVRRRHVIHAV